MASILELARVRWPDLDGAALVLAILDDWRQSMPVTDDREELVGTSPGLAGRYDAADDWPE